MANIMSMLNLKNKVSRNGFDLSEKVAFSSKAGELLPIVTKEVIPGDKFQINLKWFTRTRPVNTAAYTRMREYYDFFFVPTRLLWKDFQPFVTQMTDNGMRASSINEKDTITDKQPYFTVKQIADYLNNMEAEYLKGGTGGWPTNGSNIFGFSRSKLSNKLLSYLGYGDYTEFIPTSSGEVDTKKFDKIYSDNATAKEKANIALNPFPLLSYQKIYQDFYREQQWEKSQPWTYNVDYLKSDNLQVPVDTISISDKSVSMFDLQYCNWNKDLFMGILPTPQYGAESTVTLNSGDFAFKSTEGAAGTAVHQMLLGDNGKSYLKVVGESSPGNVREVTLQSNLSILALRQAEFLQKWKEIAISGQQDYKHQVEKHFGVKVPDCMSDHVQYVGGTADNVDINEVVNSNITETNEADIAGKGVGVGNGYIDFEAKEHGILMCIYHCVPLLDYATFGIDKFNTKTTVTDYAIPEMDSIGMESLNLPQYSNYSEVLKAFYKNGRTESKLGYVPRYIDYKTSYDKVRGSFQFTDASWCAPITNEYLKNYIDGYINATWSGSLFSYALIKCNPQVLNSIFAVEVNSDVSTDQFLVNSAFDIKAVRNLDVNGLPY